MSARTGYLEPTFGEMEAQRQDDWRRQFARFRGPEKGRHPNDAPPRYTAPRIGIEQAPPLGDEPEPRDFIRLVGPSKTPQIQQEEE